MMLPRPPHQTLLTLTLSNLFSGAHRATTGRHRTLAVVEIARTCEVDTLEKTMIPLLVLQNAAAFSDLQLIAISFGNVR